MMTMAVGQQERRSVSEVGRPTFERAARSVMREVQESFARLVAAIPSSQIAKAADLQKALDVDPKLGWRIFRIANAENALAAGAEVPSAVSMRKLFKAALRKRVPESAVKRAARAFEKFEQLVSEHAGDRDSFASMISALSTQHGGESPVDVQQRKAVFKGNSHIYGIQARARISCTIIQPNESDPTLVDGVILRGIIGLCQLRCGRSVPISAAAVHDNDGRMRRNPEIERLDLVDNQYGINMLRDFCSKPLPTIRNVKKNDWLVTELINSDVGNGGAFTGFFCDVFRKADARYRDSRNSTFLARSQIETPFESAVQDAFIRKGTYAEQPLKFETMNVNTLREEAIDREHSDVLFRDEPARFLGIGADAMHLGDYPRYVEMIEHIMGRLGWEPSEFEAYRYRLEYPVMHSAVVMECPLPEKPPA